jgi:hypothetical protein
MGIGYFLLLFLVGEDDGGGFMTGKEMAVPVAVRVDGW